MLSQTKAMNKWRDLFLKNVPCLIGVETKIWYQSNLHSKKITKLTSSSERLQSSHFAHKAISLTINWLREGVDHWRNLRRVELINAMLFRQGKSESQEVYVQIWIKVGQTFMERLRVSSVHIERFVGRSKSTHQKYLHLWIKRTQKSCLRQQN